MKSFMGYNIISTLVGQDYLSERPKITHRDRPLGHHFGTKENCILCVLVLRLVSLNYLSSRQPTDETPNVEAHGHASYCNISSHFCPS